MNNSVNMQSASPSQPAAAHPLSPPFNPRNKQIQRSDVVAILSRHVVVESDDIGNVEVYRRALTHPSYCRSPQHAALPPEGCYPLQHESYERLEYLGDAVLNLIVASYLFERYPGENEGFLTRMRTKLVNGAMLAELCGKYTKLGEFVMLSKTVEGVGSEGRVNKKVLEDAFEAFLGAIFVERGYDIARRWLVGFLEENVDFAHLVTHQKSPKETLNRYMMAQHGGLPRFEEMPCPKQGHVGVAVRRKVGAPVIATGSGANKKEAEDAAARNALEYYGLSSYRS